MNTQARQVWRRFWFVGVLCSLFVSSWMIPSNAQAQNAEMGIAAFQVLGIKDKLGEILKITKDAYEKHTGKKALDPQAVNARLGENGLPKLKECSTLVACLLQKGKQHLKTRYALFVGVGGFGGSVLMDYKLLDLQAGKQIQNMSQQYTSLEDMRTKLPSIMKKLFPATQTQLVIQGSPEGAQITLDGKPVGTVPSTMEVAPGKPLQLKVTHPGHRSLEQSVQVEEGQTKTMTIELPKDAAVGGAVGTNPSDKDPDKVAAAPWYSRWWVWAIAGGVAVGVGVAIVAANSGKTVWPEVEVSF